MIEDSARDWEVEREPCLFVSVSRPVSKGDLVSMDDVRHLDQVEPLDGDILVSPVFGLHDGIRVSVHALETEVAALTPCGRKVLSLWQTNAFEVT